MSRRSTCFPRRLGAAALLSLLLAAPAGAETLDGQVLPAAAAAVARVEIWPACPGPAGPGAPAGQPLASVRPGKDGRFEIAAPGGEPLRLRVEAEGYLPAERAVGSDPRLPVVRLAPSEVLELALVGPGGEPLAGLPLQLHPDGAAPRPAADGWRTPLQYAVSDADGRARFRRAAGDLVALFVAAPRLLAIRQLPAGSPQRLVLTPGRPVTLAVADPRGRKAPGARVLLPDGSEVGRTGPDGRLELAAPAEDLPLIVIVTTGAGAGLLARVRLEPGAGPILQAALQPALEIAGRVIDRESGQPIAGAHLAARCRAATRSAADGGFQLAVPQTEDAVIVRADGYLSDALLLEEVAAQGLSSVTVALRPAAALAVRVVDEAGEPVGGAQVTAKALTAGRGGPAKALSGADGRARLTVEAGTRFEVTAEHADFATARGTAATPPPGSAGTGTELRLTLTRGATAAGRLTTGEGEPIAGGTVALRPDPGGGRLISSRGKAHREVIAGADGRFEVHHLAPGAYQLTARAADRVPARLTVEVPAGTPRVDVGTVRLDPGAVLEGRVLDERGRPLAGAAVFLVGEPGGQQPVETGADGAFRIADLEPGQVRFHVLAEGYVETSRDQTLPSGEPLVVRLQPARALTGRVVGPRGEPAAGAQLRRIEERAMGGMSSLGTRDLAQADAEGRFRAGGLAPGPLTLQVEAPGFLVRELRVEIPEDRDAAPLEIALEAGAVIEGRVLAAGRPVVQAEVSAEPVESMRPLGRPAVTTDGEGRFRLAGLATGPHRVMALADDGRQGTADLEVAPGTQQLDLHLTTGELTGRVVDAAGRPVAGAEVTFGRSSAWSTTRSAADGSFTLQSVAPGTYRLSARHATAGAAELPEVQVADGPVALPDLVLQPDTETAAVAGRLLGLAARDLRWARVLARRVAPAGGAPEAGVAPEGTQAMRGVDADGTYQLAGLLPGTWELEAHAGARRPVRREVRLIAGETAAVDLPFTAGATLAGRVLLDGQPAGGLSLALDPDGGATRSGDDGTFALRDLPAGAYTLQVTVHPGGVWTQAVQVREDQAGAEREIEVQVPAGVLAGRVHSAAGPVAGALVSAEGQEGLGPHAVTGEDGTFRLRLLPGSYRVRVRAGGRPELETVVAITAGGEVQLDLPLP